MNTPRTAVTPTPAAYPSPGVTTGWVNDGGPPTTDSYGMTEELPPPAWPTEPTIDATWASRPVTYRKGRRIVVRYDLAGSAPASESVYTLVEVRESNNPYQLHFTLRVPEPAIGATRVISASDLEWLLTLEERLGGAKKMERSGALPRADADESRAEKAMRTWVTVGTLPPRESVIVWLLRRMKLVVTNNTASLVMHSEESPSASGAGGAVATARALGNSASAGAVRGALPAHAQSMASPAASMGASRRSRPGSAAGGGGGATSRRRRTPRTATMEQEQWLTRRNRAQIVRRFGPWEECRDRQTGETFYFNAATNTGAAHLEDTDDPVVLELSQRVKAGSAADNLQLAGNAWATTTDSYYSRKDVSTLMQHTHASQSSHFGFCRVCGSQVRTQDHIHRARMQQEVNRTRRTRTESRVLHESLRDSRQETDRQVMVAQATDMLELKKKQQDIRQHREAVRVSGVCSRGCCCVGSSQRCPLCWLGACQTRRAKAVQPFATGSLGQQPKVSACWLPAPPLCLSLYCV